MPSWVVQVASLGSIEKANGLASKLKNSGFSAFVEKAEVRGKIYYRVRVGPELDRANAERTAAMLRQQQKLDTLIQRYPSN
ncbi:SPOR domain-containing protein [Thiorhodococcus fuscus]|uniref:SPOR domain-containing protein n=2 Tax=Thiorhodococcus fuscus TaxID=527200 RepID=A0ABW4YAN3_9GAMM